ncbi:MAG: DUF305 domain-containing protein [Gemmatimonadaceae bacterium]
MSRASVLVAAFLIVGVASTHRAGAQAGSGIKPSPADVRFMQGMIAHHAQALAMTALLRDRTTRPDMRLLAERIDVSQKDEIGLMRHWLLARNERAPDPIAPVRADTTGHSMSMPGMDMSMPDTILMPGMLTAEQMAELGRARGPDFDRLFLQDMIRHHEGALVMVHDLFATNGAAQEPEIFQYASDVDADQRAEIMRMRALLAASPGEKHRSAPSPTPQPYNLSHPTRPK